MTDFNLSVLVAPFSESFFFMFDRIISDPEILSGKPVIRGTRISVEIILEWLGSGASREQILEKHPQLVAEDIQQATAFASAAFQNDVVLNTKAAS